MLFSPAFILFSGFAFGGIMQKLKEPPLLGMMITGVVLGPHVLNLIAPSILVIAVGTAVDIGYIGNAGIPTVMLIIISLAFRMIGVFLCLIKTKLNAKERLFAATSYLPKATVQAAIGAIPLSLGITAGNTILTVAVLAIMITAPIGAIGIDLTYKKLLVKDNDAKT